MSSFFAKTSGTIYRPVKFIVPIPENVSPMWTSLIRFIKRGNVSLEEKDEATEATLSFIKLSYII